MNRLLRIIIFFLCVYSHGQQYVYDKDSLRVEMDLLIPDGKGIVKIYNNFNHSIIILRNDPISNYESPEFLAIHIDNMITDPDIMPDYQQVFYLVKPGEFITVEKRNIRTPEKIKEVSVIFNALHPAKFSNKCKRKIKKNIGRNNFYLDLECIAQYQEEISLGQVVVKFTLE